MKLFFETGSQAIAFLCMVPLGFAVMLLLELSKFGTALRIITDVFVLLLAGFAVLAAVVFCQEDTLRLYHLLGLLTGALLCTQGVGKIIRWIIRKQDLKYQRAK